MRPIRALHIVLSLIAIAGFLLFIAACAPSWNPDGSQIVFDYGNANTKEFGIALYDVASGKATSIYTYHAKGQSQPRVSAQWKDDGRSVLIFIYDESAPAEDKSFLAEVAPNGDLVRTIKLKDDVYFAPAAEVRGYLYLWGDHPIKVNLSTGEWTEFEVFANTYFFRSADQALFLTNGTDENDRDVFFIGNLEPDSRKPTENYVEFQITNHSESAVDGLVPPPATDPSGRIAFPIARKDETYFIAICDQHGLLRTLEPKLDSHSKLGNLQWSPDGSSLYAGVLGSIKKDVAVWSVAEINAETGDISRMIPISQMDSSEGDVDETFFHFFPVMISPDGRTLATNLAGAPEKSVADSDRALFLIDLGGKSGKVTKIPYPTPAAK